MSRIVADFYYSKDHEWVQVVEDGRVRVGISDFAQEQLGEIVFVELPESDSAVEADESVGSIESVKAVSDLYSPVSGTVLQVNESLEDLPEIVNESPFDEGWLMEVQLKDPGQLEALLNADQYRKLIEGEEG
ncbi:glycine cleavage system protein GcvH [Paludifilum halophilum]|uniref:Glycine cleavage system H protein n=1 Tax=Paludifilum halophilum TaxID=1642702 RepID=A0A235B9Y3_9BACL|nr:glycine cleavage system protein GcvH [Paludifilum halophilum]OYD09113.1 glycine cleavage system protein H [Paludifilum halophilum]